MHTWYSLVNVFLCILRACLVNATWVGEAGEVFRKVVIKAVMLVKFLLWRLALLL